MIKAKIFTSASVAILVAVGVVGCSRTETAGPQPLLDPAAQLNGAPYAATNAAPYGSSGVAPYDDRASSADYATYTTVRSPVRTITSIEAPPPVYVEQQRPVTEIRYRDRREHSRRSSRGDRPFSHSVAIVGGSAGAGAIIGAVAGGGKGAGIGALAGGGAGLVYDRMTHKRRD